jgi:opacity protein-like surface antigen
MRKQLLGGVAVIAITTAISGVGWAADAPVRMPVKSPAFVAPPPIWSGWYVGGHLGLGRSGFSAIPHSDEVTNDGVARPKPSGIIGGMHIGQNWQTNTFVYGWEADVSAAGLNKTSTFSTNPSRTFHADVDLLASLRGRLGMTLDPTMLFYLTGGLAYTRASFLQISPDGTRQSGKINKFGWVAGLGAEWKQTPNLSWRLEGLWYRFNKTVNIPATFDGPGKATFKDALVVRVGATYHYSDKRLKRDVALLSRRDDGVGIYRYRYLWSDEVYVGVMAQEVARIVPDAVACGADGYLRVNYRRLGLRLMKWDEWEGCKANTLAMAA